MTKTAFEIWGREAEELRDQALKEYKRAKKVEERDLIVKKLEASLNRMVMKTKLCKSSFRIFDRKELTTAS